MSQSIYLLQAKSALLFVDNLESYFLMHQYYIPNILLFLSSENYIVITAATLSLQHEYVFLLTDFM